MFARVGFLYIMICIVFIYMEELPQTNCYVSLVFI